MTYNFLSPPNGFSPENLKNRSHTTLLAELAYNNLLLRHSQLSYFHQALLAGVLTMSDRDYTSNLLSSAEARGVRNQVSGHRAWRSSTKGAFSQVAKNVASKIWMKSDFCVWLLG